MAAPKTDRQAHGEVVDTAECSERMKARMRSAMARHRWVEIPRAPTERELALQRGRRHVRYAAVTLLLIALGIALAPGWVR